MIAMVSRLASTILATSSGDNSNTVSGYELHGSVFLGQNIKLSSLFLHLMLTRIPTSATKGLDQNPDASTLGILDILEMHTFEWFACSKRRCPDQQVNSTKSGTSGVVLPSMI